MNIIGRKYIFLSISGLLILASISVIYFWGLKLGIDFTGGSLLEIEFQGVRPSSEIVRSAVSSAGVDASIQTTGESGFILRFASVGEEEHQKILESLRRVSPEGVAENRFDTIGPTVGAEVKKDAISALVLALVAIVLYIAWAFRRVSKPVSSWKYGIVAIAALIHDVLIPAGVFAVLGKFQGIEVDIFFVTALLTVLGFSVHDTIVVFDRIRENLGRLKGAEPFELTVNRSMNETIVRSVNTSLTVLLVLFAVFFFGGATVRYFSLALALGIVSGTYSSIFVASPLLVLWHSWNAGRRR